MNLPGLPLFHYRHEQWFALPPEAVFEFFECPENLSLVTPPALDFRQLTPAPVAMREGAVIDYTIRRFGLRWRWRTLISVYRPPLCFVDEQLLGPYSYWRHEHRFEADNGGTRMHDEVRYALLNLLPSGVAGWMERRLVRPQLEEIFRYRERRFGELLNDHTRSRGPRPGRVRAV